MSEIQSVFKNTSWLSLAQVTNTAFAFVWIILIARYLGVGDFGVLSFATAFGGIVQIFTDLGLSTYITRELSRNPESTKKIISNSIPLKIVISTIIFILTFIILNLIGYDKLTIEVTLIITLQTIFMSMGYLFNGVFQAHEKMKYQAIGILINTILMFVGFLVGIFLDLGIISIALVYLIGSIITLIYLYYKTSTKIVSPKIEINKSSWNNLIKSSMAFGLITVLTTLYFMIDTIMLSFMKGEVAVGTYSAAYKFIMVFTTVYTVYTYVIFPLMSKLHKNSKELLKVTYEKSIKYLLILILPIAILVSFYAKDLVLLVYGQEYASSAIVLVILIWNMIFLFVNGASTSLLNSTDKEIKVTWINGIACAFNIIINLFLIHYWSYVGASISVVLTGLLLTILMNHEIAKLFKIDTKLIKDIFKIIIGTIIIAIILHFTHLTIIPGVIVSLIIYLIFIISVKTIDNTDIYLIKEILGKNSKE
ncbi:flippase [Methanobrevibacter filiformis]|nr:flippase [Methanobrevibacter filiformis]